MAQQFINAFGPRGPVEINLARVRDVVENKASDESGTVVSVTVVGDSEVEDTPGGHKSNTSNPGSTGNEVTYVGDEGRRIRAAWLAFRGESQPKRAASE